MSRIQKIIQKHSELSTYVPMFDWLHIFEKILST
jgi:hypothetical protein